MFKMLYPNPHVPIIPRTGEDYLEIKPLPIEPITLIDDPEPNFPEPKRTPLDEIKLAIDEFLSGR